MIPNYWATTWTAIGAAVGNHLWQSTLCAAAAGFLTLILRKNPPRARYWVWLVASMKFLVPFSLLVGIGSRLAWSSGAAETSGGFYFAMEQVSQPFTRPVTPTIHTTALPVVSPNSNTLIPGLLAAVWLCGFLVVLAVWFVRWRRIAAVVREAELLREGREVEALHRAEHIGRVRKQIEVRLSLASLEPGIFGIVRPVLLWPAGISERLDDAHLETILAHELEHVRRRDNLMAVLHMLVETIFWFHPIVWWMGARLVEERERACDEAVLELGSEPQVYAESILKTCEFCMGSRLACVSGVTGGELKKRIVRVMTQSVAPRLDLGRKLLLITAALLAVATPVVFGARHTGQSHAESQDENTAVTAPVFEVASIKPSQSSEGGFRIGWFSQDQYTATGTTIKMLILDAYGVEDDQVAGAPNWLNSERFDIEAKVDSSVGSEFRKLSFDKRTLQEQHMLQALLADRFRLSLHRETRELPVFALIIAKNGPKFQEAKPGDTYPDGIKDMHGKGHGNVMRMRRGQLIGQGVHIADLVQMLSQLQLGRIVLDQTGLTGKYDFNLQWTPDMDQAPREALPGADNASGPASSGPSVFTAIQEQLGLKLESRKAPVEVLVIDHVEKPSEN